MLTPGADPVRKISIIPRGLALGVTFSAPDADRFNYDRPELIAKIKVALGGRAAEEIVYGEPTHRGGVRHPAADRDRPPDGGPLGDERRTRPAGAAARGRRRAAAPGCVGGLAADPGADRRGGAGIVEEAHKEVLALLAENRAKLDSLAAALVEHETLDEDDAYAAAGVEHERSAPESALTLAAATTSDGAES